MINNFIQRIWQTRKYIQIKNVLGAHWIQPFSVVGHRTFGHKLQGDMILTNMKLLNKQLSVKQGNTLSQLFKNLQQYDNKFVKISEVPFEDQLKRKFNIFEVLAYCLIKRMQLKVKDLQLNYETKKETKQNIYFFFDLLDEMIKILHKIELKRLSKANITKDLPQNQRIYLANCAMQLVRRQIRRRFIQLCNYESQDSRGNMFYLSYEIDFQFTDVAFAAYKLITKTLDHSKCYNFLQELDLQFKNLQVHSSVKDQIRAMYEVDIEKAYYTPLRNTQDRFQRNFGYDQKGFKIIHTISFIPTNVTKQMTSYIVDVVNYLFISGLKYLGKSTNSMQIAILWNYMCQQPFLFIPVFEIDSITNSIQICTIQTFWRHFTRTRFITIQKEMQMLNKIKNNFGNKQKTVNRIRSIYRQIQTQSQSQITIQNMYVDQFQSYIGSVHKWSQGLEYYVTQKKRQLYTNLLQQLKFNYRKKVFCSSITYENNVLQNIFGISQDRIYQGQLRNYFRFNEAKRLLIVWLKICLSSAKLENYKQIYNNKNLYEQVEKKVNDCIKQLEAMNIQTTSLEGRMNILKGCAQVLLQKIIQNRSTIFNEQQLKNLLHKQS